MLGAEGVDLVEISGGTYESNTTCAGVQPGEPRTSKDAYFAGLAPRLRAMTDIPLALTGGAAQPTAAAGGPATPGRGHPGPDRGRRPPGRHAQTEGARHTAEQVLLLVRLAADTAAERLPVCDCRVSQLDGKVSLDEDGCEPVRGRGRHEVGD
jgi:hypothetical protein